METEEEQSKHLAELVAELNRVAIELVQMEDAVVAQNLRFRALMKQIDRARGLR